MNAFKIDSKYLAEKACEDRIVPPIDQKFLKPGSTMKDLFGDLGFLADTKAFLHLFCFCCHFGLAINVVYKQLFVFFNIAWC